MKVIKFREVLHTCANKLGLDPEQGNFLTNQAIPLGRYINQWVRRTYDARDWPELVVTRKFLPTAGHIVPYEDVDTVYGVELSYKLGRIFNVYLVDPRTTNSPVATDFQMLMSGVHVGHEHGTNVWIRYMFQTPRFTAEVWDANRSYAKNDVAYSPVSGECYRSRVSANRNHDPGRSFQLPPLPPDEIPPGPIESDTPPEVVVFQEYIPHDPGSPGQAKIMRVDIHHTLDHTIVPDPATANDTFDVTVFDVSASEIGAGSAVGPNTLIDVAAELTGELTSSLPVTFIVTTLAEPREFTLEDLSDFSVTATYTFQIGDSPDIVHPLVVGQLQTYIEPRPAVTGQAQATYVQFNNESTIPGALYRLTMTGGDGTPHPVEYQSDASDGMAQIVIGLAAAIDASTDEYWDGVTRQINPGQGIIFLAVNDNASTNAIILLVGDPFWEWNPFPEVLAEQVIRGAYGDLLKEWGQSDKGAAEEGAVPAETQISEGDFVPTQAPPLSGQQVPRSRYRI